MTKKNGKGMVYAILSLSLLTVMAGAAVAPALGTISEHFAGESGTLVQMIISMPALFIFLSSFVFHGLCRKFGGLGLAHLPFCFAAFLAAVLAALAFGLRKQELAKRKQG